MSFLTTNKNDMENIFICNGTTQLVVIPKNDSDRDLFLRLAEQGNLEVVFNPNPVGILDKSIKDTFIIRKKIDDTTKA
jgi:hypothetical protein